MKFCLGGDKPTLVRFSESIMVGDTDSSYMIKLNAELWFDNLDSECVALSNVEFITNHNNFFSLLFSLLFTIMS